MPVSISWVLITIIVKMTQRHVISPNGIIAHFSQRRKEIEQYLEDHGLIEAKAAAGAALKIRDNKKALNCAEVADIWQRQAKSVGFNHEHLDQKSLGITEDNTLTNESDSKSTVRPGLQNNPDINRDGSMNEAMASEAIKNIDEYLIMRAGRSPCICI